jgi:hypothetical protein
MATQKKITHVYAVQVRIDYHWTPRKLFLTEEAAERWAEEKVRLLKDLGITGIPAIIKETIIYEERQGE